MVLWYPRSEHARHGCNISRFLSLNYHLHRCRFSIFHLRICLKANVNIRKAATASLFYFVDKINATEALTAIFILAFAGLVSRREINRSRMGKRSNFKRNKHDKYPTPFEAMPFLFPHLAKRERFCEPCAGDGAMVRYLEAAGHKFVRAWDTHPRHHGIDKQDARLGSIRNVTCFITNPPWTRAVLHPIIENLSAQHPTWLLFDSDWAHTRQANGLWQKCAFIISVGRLKWIPNSKFTGKDNCCWYLFNPGHKSGPKFIGRS